MRCDLFGEFFKNILTDLDFIILSGSAFHRFDARKMKEFLRAAHAVHAKGACVLLLLRVIRLVTLRDRLNIWVPCCSGRPDMIEFPFLEITRAAKLVIVVVWQCTSCWC